MMTQEAARLRSRRKGDGSGRGCVRFTASAKVGYRGEAEGERSRRGGIQRVVPSPVPRPATSPPGDELLVPQVLLSLMPGPRPDALQVEVKEVRVLACAFSAPCAHLLHA